MSIRYSIKCAACGGRANYEGTIGMLHWYKCEDCGMQLSRRASRKKSILDVKKKSV